MDMEEKMLGTRVRCVKTLCRLVDGLSPIDAGNSRKNAILKTVLDLRIDILKLDGYGRLAERWHMVT